jgi:2-polyprenyl-6-hydroxyphenyl methylase/3-demethylubiquinone-9 3-methyltransferase
MTAAQQTVDTQDVARFSAIAEEWWDENGKFRPLHRIGPVRLKYIRDRAAAHFKRDTEQMKALSGLSVLDIGCGGGLMCEPLARLGAGVTGIDASERNIAVASLHAEKMGLDIEYRRASPEELAARSGERGEGNLDPRLSTLAPAYDIVLALEVVEHVADVPLFLKACASLVKPGGLLFMSTLNRTIKSYGLAIVGAEYVLRWLPRGTHQWKKFLKPSELCAGLRHEGLVIENMSGMVFNPFKNAWHLSTGDLDVNYLLAAIKPA